MNDGQGLIPAHSLTHPLTHALTHSLSHSLTHSLAHPLTHPPTHSPTQSFTHALTHAHTVAGIETLRVEAGGTGRAIGQTNICSPTRNVDDAEPDTPQVCQTHNAQIHIFILFYIFILYFVYLQYIM